MTFVMMAAPASHPAPPRYLVFFRKGEEQSLVDESFAGIRASTSKTVELVDSLAWFESQFASCGDWDSWALESVTGRSYRTREPHFHGFILNGDGNVGRATAQVVRLALDLRKPVYQFTGGKLTPVVSVCPQGESWRISTGDTP